MGNILYFLQKTIGQRFVLGITGLGLCGFVFIHMLGNLLILKGSESYNTYAYKLHEIKIIEILEIGLFAFFIGHIATAIIVNIKNAKAKGTSYKKRATGAKRTLLGDRLLVFQGVVLLVFLINHLLTFKFGVHYETNLNGKQLRDIYLLVTEVFQNPVYLVGYLFTLIILGYHLIHGLPASLKTLGFYHPRYMFGLQILGWVFGLIVTLGFALPIVYIYFYL